jgi:hypothetical protein
VASLLPTGFGTSGGEVSSATLSPTTFISVGGVLVCSGVLLEQEFSNHALRNTLKKNLSLVMV